MSDHVRITEVAPRDGLQNEPTPIPTSAKVQLIRLLLDTRVDEIEVSSFVSKEWIPQLGDAPQVFDALAALIERPDHRRNTDDPRPIFSALVPNQIGMDAALHANQRAGFKLISKVALFTAASETFAKKNTNATIAETIKRFAPVIAAARDNDIQIRAYISCAIACPFEGPIPPTAVADLAATLVEAGATEVDLGDTIGHATPQSTTDLLKAVAATLGNHWTPKTTLHLHDTFSRAAQCVQAALREGIRSFDASVAGIGGCPYASTPDKRAPGNIATETLVRAITDAGHTTNVDNAALTDAASFARQLITESRSPNDSNTLTPPNAPGVVDL